MSESTQNPQSTQSVPSASWLPLLVRALISLVYGAVTIFWLHPSLDLYATLAGVFLLLLGGTVLFQAYAGANVPGLAGKTVGLVTAAAGVAALVIPRSDLSITLALALGLAVLGAGEIGWAIRLKGVSPLARDWIISGTVGVLTAILLPFFANLGAHALLGVSGGGAVICGVLWVLAALSLRHDARQTPLSA